MCIFTFLRGLFGSQHPIIILWLGYRFWSQKSLNWSVPQAKNIWVAFCASCMTKQISTYCPWLFSGPLNELRIKIKFDISLNHNLANILLFFVVVEFKCLGVNKMSDVGCTSSSALPTTSSSPPGSTKGRPTSTTSRPTAGTRTTTTWLSPRERPCWTSHSSEKMACSMRPYAYASTTWSGRSWRRTSPKCRKRNAWPEWVAPSGWQRWASSSRSARPKSRSPRTASTRTSAEGRASRAPRRRMSERERPFAD